MEETTDKIDETILLVRGNMDKHGIKKLSRAVLKVVNKHGMATFRCIGAASVNNAVKAATIAKMEAEKNGISLLIDPSFTQDKEKQVTAMKLQVIIVDD